MSEANKQIVRRFIDEVWNQARLEVADELVHPLYENNEGAGPEAVKRNVRAFKSAFPDLHDSIEALIAEGDFVAARVTRSGTHLGTFRDVYEASGRAMSITELCLWRIEDGKLREGWFAAHEISLRKQLGVIPESLR
ncbi:MAG TPA: ester cyclase [Thermomicrobiales bacterium]|nr:ester cyclase [Thermomicrobiales bacterium]